METHEQLCWWVASCHLMTLFLLLARLLWNGTRWHWMCLSSMSAQCWQRCWNLQLPSSRSQVEIPMKPAILLWGPSSVTTMWGGKKEWGVQGEGICKILHVLPSYTKSLLNGKTTNFHSAMMVLYFLPSSLPPSLLFTLFLPAPPILLSFLRQYIFWLPLAPQICQEVSYWDLLEPLQLQLLGCWMLLNQKTLRWVTIIYRTSSQFDRSLLYMYCSLESLAAVLDSWREGYSGRPAAVVSRIHRSEPSNTRGTDCHGRGCSNYHLVFCSCHQCQVHLI